MGTRFISETMAKDKKASKNQEENEVLEAENQTVTEEQVEEKVEEQVKEPELSAEEKLELELAEAKDKYLRLYSEFENFRRRNAKERIDLIKTASSDLMVELLPTIDDFMQWYLNCITENIRNYNDDQNKKIMAKGLISKKMRNKIQEIDPTVDGFNIGTNSGKISGQSIMHCHIHLIPRRKNDVDNPQGGVRGVIPSKQHYQRKK